MINPSSVKTGLLLMLASQGVRAQPLSGPTLKPNPLLPDDTCPAQGLRTSAPSQLPAPPSRGDQKYQRPERERLSGALRASQFRSPAEVGLGGLSSIAEKVSRPESSQANPAAPQSWRKAAEAAKAFAQKFQAQALNAPGSVLASREALGLAPNDFAMLDIGGEGQKTDPYTSLKSGSVHAINVNVQPTISSTPIWLAEEPDGPLRRVDSEEGIPNLVRPGNDWPRPDEKKPWIPLADGFSNLSMMEGTPVFDCHVAELARVTSKTGWIVLTVAPDYNDQVATLAKQHNGGEVWRFESSDTEEGGFPRFVVPPRNQVGNSELRAQFEDVDSHGLHDLLAVSEPGRQGPAERQSAQQASS